MNGLNGTRFRSFTDLGKHLNIDPTPAAPPVPPRPARVSKQGWAQIDSGRAGDSDSNQGTAAAVTTSKGRRAMQMTGIIKRIVTDKGFGFVKAEDGTEFFFHRSTVANGLRFEDLREGERVTFDEGDGPKGPRAENVERA